MSRLTKEREDEIRELAIDPWYINYVAFTGTEMLELLSEIDSLRAENKESMSIFDRIALGFKLDISNRELRWDNDELKAENAKLQNFYDRRVGKLRECLERYKTRIPLASLITPDAADYHLRYGLGKDANDTLSVDDEMERGGK